MQILRTLIASIGSVLVAAVPAAAEGRWSIGAFAGVQSDYYVGSDSWDDAFGGLLAYDTAKLHIGFDGISYRFLARSDVTLGVALGVRADPDFPDGALFDGLERDSAIEAGLFARYEIGTQAYIAGSLMQDVSSAHHGFEADLSVGTEHALGMVNLDLSLGGKFRDGDLNQYLVGVSSGEANGRRAAYTPGASVIPYIEVTSSVPLSDNITFVGAVSYQHLGSAYEDSPLVDHSNTGSLDLGLVYQF